jgi:RNase P/RNase MRP subunit p29
MRWPDIFFKSRKSNPPPARDAASKSKVPSISELEKSVEPSPAQVAAARTTTESLRALKQKDSILLVPRDAKETSAKASTLEDKAPTVAPKPEASFDSSATATAPVRRKAKLTDFARVLLPKEESSKDESSTSEASSPAPEPSPASVVPAAFPVAGTAGNVMESKSETPGKTDSHSETSTAQPVEAKSENASSSGKKDSPPTIEAEPQPRENSAPVNEVTSAAREASLKDTTRVTLPESVIHPPAKPTPASTSIETSKPAGDPREKREFILANGERILGHVLSETADTIYLDHHTLGVLTLPRTQIAGKPIEVILINGDRIVGDLIAETSECLYIRHASLGMLTVPHSQRSTRVVEAILKDGDRILGEVLAETDHFTVIRSATLGTVAVQHEQVAMLNRKIEQMQLRSLPAPALEDAKPGPASS